MEKGMVKQEIEAWRYVEGGWEGGRGDGVYISPERNRCQFVNGNLSLDHLNELTL